MSETGGKAVIGYHASHEQFTPSRLLGLVAAAERAGFGAAMCSDHVLPWSERQGQSGFAWSWLGSALQASSLSFGVVNAPGDRYHPAIIAQAAATLAEMYPGRFWIAAGSGEYLNEHITGAPWPDKATRNRRLRESVEVMRRLWRGETVDFSGEITVKRARLYTTPDRPVPVFGAALSPETAKLLAGWADGLITVSGPIESVRNVISAWNEGGGGGKPVYLQVKLAWALSDREAFDGAWDQWRVNVLPAEDLAGLMLPEEFDAAGAHVTRERLESHVLIGSDPGMFRARLEEYLALGVSRLYLHNVGRNQDAFIETFGSRVLPAFG